MLGDFVVERVMCTRVGLEVECGKSWGTLLSSGARGLLRSSATFQVPCLAGSVLARYDVIRLTAEQFFAFCC